MVSRNGARIYNGRFIANYRLGTEGVRIATVREINLRLEMAAGTASIGEILPYASPDRASNSSLQPFGDANFLNGTFRNRNLRFLVNSGNSIFLETT